MSKSPAMGDIAAADSSPIVLTTLNARYIHSAFGLRYLQANLGEFECQSSIAEFTLEVRPEDAVEKLLSYRPKIVGFGVYIWNVQQTEKVVRLLQAVAPEVVVVLGGPEVSYEQHAQTIVALADFVVSGWGEQSFAELVSSLLTGTTPTDKFIVGKQPKLDQIRMPYYLYNDDDLKNRVLYVEASRGCPFKCEFCLSALDKTAWPFDLELFLQEMDNLYQRGARHFKFVDRTFNLKVKNSLKILEFFLARMDRELFLHFEVVPDHLPVALKDMIGQFPAGSLQFEIGIQTFNPEVQQRISRKQNNQAAAENIRWIREHSKAHIHADLIFGLPGESTASFAQSFDQLYRLRPHEIQVGILKRLKGSPIVRHTKAHKMVFDPNPPFSILASDCVDFGAVQELNRFARYWDLVANSGRFKQTLPLLLADRPYHNFSIFSQALYELSGQTHKISLLRLFDYVFEIADQYLRLPSESVRAALAIDFTGAGLKSTPSCIRDIINTSRAELISNKRRQRQARH